MNENEKITINKKTVVTICIVSVVLIFSFFVYFVEIIDCPECVNGTIRLGTFGALPCFDCNGTGEITIIEWLQNSFFQ